VLHQAGSTILDGASYSYDAAGNRTAKTDQASNVTSSYGYDALYQLTGVTQGAGTTESYTYDPVGNRLTSLSVPGYNYNSSNQLTSTSSGSYTYDANGNTLSDASGKSYTWDFENRLAQAVVPGTGTTTFKYDPFGRRIQKSGPLGTTNYLYAGANIVEEVDAGGAVLAGYTFGPNIDEPLAELPFRHNQLLSGRRPRLNHIVDEPFSYDCGHLRLRHLWKFVSLHWFDNKSFPLYWTGV